MAFQFSVALRDALAAAIEPTIGASPTFEIRSGAAPVNAGAADTGVVLATMALPADFFTTPVSGQISKLGTWEDLTADAAGVAGHFRIKQGAATYIQGPVVEGVAAAGQLGLDNTNLAVGQQVTITGFSITIGGE